LLDAVGDFERIRARRPEDRAAPREDPDYGFGGHRDDFRIERAFPSVAKPDDRVAVHVRSLPHHRADHRVEPGGVAPSGKDADTHGADTTPTGARPYACARASRGPRCRP